MTSLRREIAVLQVEADMIESHVHKLVETASQLTDSDDQHNLLLLADEETDEATTIRIQIQLLKERMRTQLPAA
jgi:hypothetical protein